MWRPRSAGDKPAGLANGYAVSRLTQSRLHDEALRDYHPLPAARADLLRKLGRTTEAAAAYRAALELASNERERAFLRKKLTEL
jgi:predicted RNA polymerase sigma factor